MAHVRLVPDARLGVNFLEFGATPRASAVVYDRKNSAASTIAIASSMLGCVPLAAVNCENKVEPIPTMTARTRTLMPELMTLPSTRSA